MMVTLLYSHYYSFIFQKKDKITQRSTHLTTIEMVNTIVGILCSVNEWWSWWWWSSSFFLLVIILFFSLATVDIYTGWTNKQIKVKNSSGKYYIANIYQQLDLKSVVCVCVCVYQSESINYAANFFYLARICIQQKYEKSDISKWQKKIDVSINNWIFISNFC